MNRGSAIIRNNIITQNGNETEYIAAPGICVVLSETTINNNTIANNYNSYNGAGIQIVIGTSTLYENTFTGNKSNGNGGAIVIGQDLNTSMARGNISGTKATLYGNSFTSNQGDKGGAITVYEDAFVYNKVGEAWRAFNMPHATVTFVEHNANTDDNNTYTNNSLNEDFSSSRDGVEESTDIWFDGEATSATGTLELSPATATGNAGEKMTLTATLTINTVAYNGTVAFTLPFATTEDASITIGGEKRPINPTELFNDNKGIGILGINSTDTQTVAVTFNYTPVTSMDQDVYMVSAAVDVDGADTRYTQSDFTEATLTIPPQ